MGKLTGKVALVTGGARGLGRAYALHLAALGADVGILDIDLKSYQAYRAEQDLMTAPTVMDEVMVLGPRACGVTADISNRDQVTAAVEEIAAQLGPIDICVCNAGGGSGKTWENTASAMDFDQYHAVLARNLHGTVYTVNAVAPMMKEKRAGKIVTVSSHVGLEVSADLGYVHYGTAKAGILFYTRAAAAELGAHNIQVNCMAPGYIATARMDEQFSARGYAPYLRRTSLGRMGTADDCCGVLEFLVTDLSDFVTGETISITGGTTGKLGP